MSTPAASVPTGPAPAAPLPAAGWRWPPWTAMAWVTFLEFWRRWFLLGLLFIGLLPAALATFLPADAQRGAERVELVILWGLGGVAFGGAVGASMMGSLQTPLEIEDRRIYGLVCRPISRWRLMVGKMVGISAFLTLYAAVAYLALAGMIGWTLHGQADAEPYLVTRHSSNATMLGFNLEPQHIRVLGDETQFQQTLDFTRLGPISDWGHSPKPRYRWVLLTVIRSRDGRPQPGGQWPDDRKAFEVVIGSYFLPQFVTIDNEVRDNRNWEMEKSGHVVLIIPEGMIADQPAAAVKIGFRLAPGYFQPGDTFFFSDLAVYDKLEPPYDKHLKAKIPFIETILTIDAGQSVDYLLAPPAGAALPSVDNTYIGLHLKSAAMFRDIFSVDAALLDFDPARHQFAPVRKSTWVVHEKKTVWAQLTAPPGLDPVKNPSFGPPGPDLEAAGGAGGWRVFRLTGRAAVPGDGSSGALFQLENQGDVRLAAAHSNLWCNLAMGFGLFFIQWLCLTVVIVAWSGNLSLGVSLLCSLIMAVACYGSGSARSVLTEEHRSYEYRTEMLKKHPEIKAEPISDWQFALNRMMYAIVWTPPNFIEFSPTERVKTQDDIGFTDWGSALLNLFLYRSLPVALVGLVIFQRREF